MTMARMAPALSFLCAAMAGAMAGACSDAEELEPPRLRKPTTASASASFQGNQAAVYTRAQDYCGVVTTIDEIIASRCTKCHGDEAPGGISIRVGDASANLRVLVDQGLAAPDSALVSTYLAGKHEPLSPPLSACELDAVSRWLALGAPLLPTAPEPPLELPDGGRPDAGDAGGGGGGTLQDTLFHTKTGPKLRSVEDVLMACRQCHTDGPAYVDAAGVAYPDAKLFLELVAISPTSWPVNLAKVKAVKAAGNPKTFRLHIPSSASKADPKADLASAITVKPGRLSHEHKNYPGSTQDDLNIVNAWLAAYGK